MTEDIIRRFKRVRAVLDKPSFTLQADVSEDGIIVFNTKRGCGILASLFGVLIPAVLVILTMQNWDDISSPVNYLFVAFPGVIGILFLVALVYAIMCPNITCCAIDPILSQIVIYGTKFPCKRGPREVIKLEDIQLFLAYLLKLWWRQPVPSQSYIYVVTNDGLSHAICPAWPSPDMYVKALGYVCQKLAIHVVEPDPSLGPASDNYSGPPIYDRRHLNINTIMSKGQILYNPESDNDIDLL